MNTTLSSAQEAAKAQYEQFALDNVAPIARQLDERKANLKKLLQEIGRQGYLGLTVSKEYGGSANLFLHAVLFAEAVAQHEPGLCLSYAAHLAVEELLIKFGTVSQKSRYLPLLARGESLGTLAIAEDTAGSDFKAVTSRVVKNSGQLLLSGKKVWVLNADTSALAAVLARNELDELGIYLLDMENTDTLQISPNREKLGLRSASTNNVELSNHVLHPEALLGGNGAPPADQGVQFALDVAKVIVAAAALGLSESAFKYAREHARSRQQFGTSIGQFQAIQWKLADASCDIGGARLLTYRAAWAKDEEPAKFRLYAAMAKALVAKVARVQSGEAMQVLGAHGLMVESPLERFYRDAKAMEIVCETSELQKQIIAQELGVQLESFTKA